MRNWNLLPLEIPRHNLSFSTHNLLCRKFAVVCRKTAISCPPRTFATHDAADRCVPWRWQCEPRGLTKSRMQHGAQDDAPLQAATMTQTFRRISARSTQPSANNAGGGGARTSERTENGDLWIPTDRACTGREPRAMGRETTARLCRAPRSNDNSRRAADGQPVAVTQARKDRVLWLTDRRQRRLCSD